MDAQAYRELMLQRVNTLTEAWVEYNPNEPGSWRDMNRAIAALVNAAEVEITREAANG